MPTTTGAKEVDNIKADGIALSPASLEQLRRRAVMPAREDDESWQERLRHFQAGAISDAAESTLSSRAVSRRASQYSDSTAEAAEATAASAFSTPSMSGRHGHRHAVQVGEHQRHQRARPDEHGVLSPHFEVKGEEGDGGAADLASASNALATFPNENDTETSPSAHDFAWSQRSSSSSGGAAQRASNFSSVLPEAVLTDEDLQASVQAHELNLLAQHAQAAADDAILRHRQLNADLERERQSETYRSGKEAAKRKQ
jgi:hypothetical protein